MGSVTLQILEDGPRWGHTSIKIGVFRSRRCEKPLSSHRGDAGYASMVGSWTALVHALVPNFYQVITNALHDELVVFLG